MCMCLQTQTHVQRNDQRNLALGPLGYFLLETVLLVR